MDNRPRWETRYLKNLFERDERWDVTCVWGGIGSSNDKLARGKEGDVFPDEKNILFSYDLIVYGELEANELKTKELESAAAKLTDKKEKMTSMKKSNTELQAKLQRVESKLQNMSKFSHIFIKSIKQ